MTKHKLYLISGDGIGAGKTTLAGILGHRFSLALALREHCCEKYEDRWFFETAQAAKSRIFRGNKTYRDVLIEESEKLKLNFGQDIWVKKVVAMLMRYRYFDCCIDDMRFVYELEYFRKHLSDEFDIVHVHVLNADAKKEEHTDNVLLSEKADMFYSWNMNKLNK